MYKHREKGLLLFGANSFTKVELKFLHIQIVVNNLCEIRLNQTK